MPMNVAEARFGVFRAWANAYPHNSVENHIDEAGRKINSGRKAVEEARKNKDPEAHLPMQTISEALGELSCEDGKTWAPIENLPPEIRHLIISYLDLESLKSFVQTSQLFYLHYTSDRIYLLRQCLQNTLGIIIVDAFAAYSSGLESFAQTRNKNQTKNFLESYVKWRSHDYTSVLYKDLADDHQIQEIVKIYFLTIKPISRHFTEWALSNLVNEDEKLQTCSDKPPKAPKPLSRLEELRVLRALYRFQIYCNTFGRGPHIIKKQIIMDFHYPEIFRLLFCIFEPWEADEVNCIHAFAEQKFEQVFRSLSSDELREISKRHIPVDSTNDPISWVLEETTSRGLELLSAMFRIQNHDILVSTMLRYASSICGWPLRMVMFCDAQDDRWYKFPSDRDEKQRRLDPLPFDGDEEPDGNHRRPPLAWTLIWKGTYSCLFGYYFPDEFHKCGYLLWDADRIEYHGGKAIFDRYLELVWDDWDVRDTFA
ncbi:hypothetical protein FQN57_005832 [Myotisia sp. PD_48]|nr:hypothetical protein FQN57_005832 [Myotisia sp. PD_48]